MSKNMLTPSPSTRLPRIAVIVPVYNSSLYLAECLNSLLAQTYKNFCVFAINDGSTDSSSEILELYKKRDSRIYVAHKTNGGVSSARNAALNLVASSETTFDFVCFVDSDDLVTPNFLSDYAKVCSTENLDYVVCGWNCFDKHGIGQSKHQHAPIDIDQIGAFDQFFAMGNWIDTNLSSFSNFLSNRCFSSRVALSLRFNEKLIIAEDQDFITRALFLVQKGYVFSHENYFYRKRLSSLMHGKNSFDSESYYDNLIKIYNKAPKYAKRGILSHAIYYWWLSIKLRIADGTFKQFKEKFDRDYSFFKLNSHYCLLNAKLKRRLLYYSFGFHFLKLYLSIKTLRRPHTDLDSYYE